MSEYSHSLFLTWIIPYVFLQNEDPNKWMYKSGKSYVQHSFKKRFFDLQRLISSKGTVNVYWISNKYYKYCFNEKLLSVFLFKLYFNNYIIEKWINQNIQKEFYFNNFSDIYIYTGMFIQGIPSFFQSLDFHEEHLFILSFTSF